ncbi:Receptor-interacting serine/threonine-protein kinase 1 [Mitosporidium daphniae]|uniref:Serine/threonine-protein kinase Mst20 n=1 Tax=Mitosporidium daphniae TaxID=1485682 RepID=A0A098VSW7_9MICR|nr:serine/threonine-protein kinase Mst20 [Mitosporidium daphniae]KGG52080.1 serine/threonine-protein kinase Mst20 [Mitosporidium daphniae]|eukprot:XP_013238516.1 serine/threonine-protein kinase Mst20 [Mitosporidium daphniae]
MIFLNDILFLLFVFLYKIFLAKAPIEFSSKVLPKIKGQTDKVELMYVIQGAITEVSRPEHSMIYLAFQNKRGQSIDQESQHESKRIIMAKADEEKLICATTEYFVIKEILENVKIPFIEREFSIQKKLAHKNVVLVYHRNMNQIFMEYVNGCDLLDVPQYWNKNVKIFAYIFKEVAQGVKFIHQNGFVHGDLKLENILVSRDGYIKITDFGAAVETKRVSVKDAGRTKGIGAYETPYSNEEFMFTFTLPYVAPEFIDPESVAPKDVKDTLINKIGVTSKWIALSPGELKFNLKSNVFPTKQSDVFSFAATVVGFFSAKNGARYDRNYFSFQEEGKKENYSDIFNLIETFNVELAKIIHQALDPSIDKRPTIQQVLECLEKLPCSTEAEFKDFAADVQLPHITTYTKKRSANNREEKHIPQKIQRKQLTRKD